MTASFRCRERLRSFRFAFAGIWTLLKSQHNAWIHALATLVVVVAGWYCHLAVTEWCLLTLAITMVWVAEGLNTAIEYLADMVSPQFHPLIEACKDVAAGAVLLAAIGSLVIGLLVFGPHLEQLWH